MLEKVGVRIYVLRKQVGRTEVLLVRPSAGPARGEWAPVVGAIGDEETELGAALRALEEIAGLEPRRLYATSVFSESAEGALGRPGRMGVFVAFVGEEQLVQLAEDHSEHVWLSTGDAPARLGVGEAQSLLRTVEAQFCKRAPDEALRVL